MKSTTESTTTFLGLLQTSVVAVVAQRNILTRQHLQPFCSRPGIQKTTPCPQNGHELTRTNSEGKGQGCRSRSAATGETSGGARTRRASSRKAARRRTRAAEEAGHKQKRFPKSPHTFLARSFNERHATPSLGCLGAGFRWEWQGVIAGCGAVFFWPHCACG